MQNLKSKPLEFKHHSHLRRKRLGQFFTGSRLARLLAALADAGSANSAIDPMAGTGDMLEAAHELNQKVKLFGIEIDNDVFAQAQVRLASLHPTLVQGNAFSYKKLSLRQQDNFDLVITNPPYVRYQNFAEGDVDGDIPSAAQVRQELLANIDLLTDPEDRRLFREIIQAYSGLSDLAVPSWILTAMLTRVGGTLALVVPESWLSRDYAQILQYILLRWFKIKYIVEDSNASWFPEALVKTTLLVAERTPRRESAFSWKTDKYAHIKISADASTLQSIVGNIYPRATSPEKKFAEEVKSLLLKSKEREAGLWSVELFSISEMAENLKTVTSGGQWLKKLENIEADSSRQITIPTQVRRLLSDSVVELRTFNQVGVAVGQGLRTGANLFFYANLNKSGNPESLIEPNKVFDMKRISVRTEFLKPVIRKQTELPDGYVLKKANLKGRVLVIPSGRKVSGDLAKLVRKAAQTKIGDIFIPELSAVKTNIKASVPWYVLPTLATRHIPQLLIPRINSDTPRSYLNSAGLVVDANFSTVWLESGSPLTPTALLALLNSSWSTAIMELSGAVMGGGALKLEATHIKRIPFPVLDKARIKKLDVLGKELARSPNPAILRRIDEAVMGVLFKKSVLPDKLRQLDTLIRQRRNERTKRS